MIVIGHTVISLSTPTIYSVYHQGGFGGYSSPTSPTSACSSTSPFGYHNIQPMALTNNCFPQGFPTRPPQAYGVVPGIHPAAAQFQHRNTLSAKNLQAFNAYQTHLYPEVYTDFRQGIYVKKFSAIQWNTFVFPSRPWIEIEQWSLQPDFSVWLHKSL